MLQTHGVDRRQPHGVARGILTAPDRVLELVIPLDDFLTALKKNLALGRQFPRSLGPVDQLRPQLFLELPHRLARRRLADRTGQRAPGEASVADHIAKNTERLNVHGTK